MRLAARMRTLSRNLASRLRLSSMRAAFLRHDCCMRNAITYRFIRDTINGGNQRSQRCNEIAKPVNAMCLRMAKCGWNRSSAMRVRSSATFRLVARMRVSAPRMSP